MAVVTSACHAPESVVSQRRSTLAPTRQQRRPHARRTAVRDEISRRCLLEVAVVLEIWVVDVGEVLLFPKVHTNGPPAGTVAPGRATNSPGTLGPAALAFVEAHRPKILVWRSSASCSDPRCTTTGRDGLSGLSKLWIGTIQFIRPTSARSIRWPRMPLRSEIGTARRRLSRRHAGSVTRYSCECSVSSFMRACLRSARASPIGDGVESLWVQETSSNGDAPVALTSVASVANTCSAVFGSTLPVASSASSTLGASATARAMATRCYSPPDDSTGR
jgi:hypothetical protein